MRDTTSDIPNTLTDAALWYRIRGAMLPVARDGRVFSEQLAEITGLGLAAARALEHEYRRFLYIAAVTSAPREPMGLLRQAWEHHASFEGYRLDFCPWVLERHLPAVAVSKLSAPAYTATRLDYRAEFGALPPAPFWPAAESRYETGASAPVKAPDAEASAV